MPQVLTMTQKPGETTEAFAARISNQMGSFFKGGGTDEASPAPTDESAAPEAPAEEPAPSA